MGNWKPPSPLPGPIKTVRTLVRPYRKGDGPRLHAAISASRDLVWLTMGWWTDGEADLDDCIYYVEKVLRRSAEPGCRHFTLAIFDPDENTSLGGCGFHHINDKERAAEIGYWLRGDRNGEGLCTEAVGALITSGLTPQEDGGWGFRRISLLCAADNVASYRVAEKLGLRLERRERAERYSDHAPTPGYLDTLGYAVLADEWDFDAQRAKPDIGWPTPL